MAKETEGHPELREQIEAFVIKWVKLLKLEHFEINVVWPEDYDKWPENDDPEWANFQADEDDHVYAFTYRSKDYDVARHYFNEALLYRLDDPRAVEVTVIHELLHVLTSDVEFIMDMLDGLLHRDVDKVVTANFRHAVESAVDRLAWRFVDIAGG